MENNKLHNELPEKMGPIESLVTVSKDVQKVVEGKKTSQRRNGRYADVGEIMNLEGKKFKMDRVYSQSLGEVTEADAKREGFDSLEDYKQSILSIHPGMKWVPQMRVWVHEFSPVEE